MALLDSREVEDTYLLERAIELPRLRHAEPLIEPGQAYGSVLRRTDDDWMMYYLHGRFKSDPARPQDNLGYVMRLARSSDGTR